jgi:DNA-binding NtrC family response regulator
MKRKPDPAAEKAEANRLAQRRWRERHARRRSIVQQVSSLLLRKKWPDGIQQLANLLHQTLNREGIRALRRALQEEMPAQQAAERKAALKTGRELWLAEHPDSRYHC